MNLIIPLSPTHAEQNQLNKKIIDKSILEHIKSNFPSNTKVHIATSQKNNTFGPIYTIKNFLENEDEITGPIFIHYCDLINFFDYSKFNKSNADLVLFTSNVIHPYRENNQDYSFVKKSPFTIQEKKSFTDQPEDEFVTTGLYYFKSKEVLLNLIYQFDSNIELSNKHKANKTCNIEQLFCLAHNNSRTLKMEVFEGFLPLKCDLDSRIDLIGKWVRYFDHNHLNRDLDCNDYEVIIPLAGLGNRFKEQNYKEIKPLLRVENRPLIEFITDTIPLGSKYHFVTQRTHIDQNHELESKLRKYPKAKINVIDGLTDGQASSAMIAVKEIDDSTPILIGACDNTAIWDHKAFKKMIESGIDIIFLSFKDHPNMESSPQSYGWMEVDETKKVTDISCKVPISDTPIKDEAIVGIFYFRKARIYKELYKKLVTQNYRVNNEFYIDCLLDKNINTDYAAYVFNVEHFLSFGTPNEYKSFFYWKEVSKYFTVEQ